MTIVKPIPDTNFPRQTITSLSLPGSELHYQPDLFDATESAHYFSELAKLSGWEARPIMVYGKQCCQNRKTNFYGEIGTNYRYSGIDNPGTGEVPEVLRLITTRVETTLVESNLLAHGQHFNYWLGNYYQDGTNNIGMHSDDERGLVGPIVSLSFGSDRYFDIRSRHSTSAPKTRLNLLTGSMLVMAGETQKNYLHGVPTQRKIKSPRINITLRMVS